jgi:hypothetical protein
MMEPVNDSQAHRDETLRASLETLWEELKFHRGTTYQISLSVNTLLTVSLGGVVAIRSNFGMGDRVGISLVIAALAIFAIRSMQTSFERYAEVARVVVRLEKALGHWDKGRFLPDLTTYPPHWREWGKSKRSFWFVRQEIATLVLLATLIIVIIWLPT